MGDLTRRDMLATAAIAGGMLSGASAAIAQTGDRVVQPTRAPGIGGNDPVPGNPIRERQNPDMLNPPATDSGTVPNLRFSFADAHVRQSSGGWTRQVTKRELGISKSIAGVQMRLNAGGVRELHWHKQAEWPTCCMGSPASRLLTPTGETLSMTSVSAISGIFPAAFHIRFKVSVPTDVNSCWSSTMGISTRTTHSCCAA